jgi:hypothetical protein
MGERENLVRDALLKASNRGHLLRFREGSKMGLVRGNMAGLDECRVALAGRLGEERWTVVTATP